MGLNKITYDYIIAGAGCAGLSLLYRLIQSNLHDANILVIDSGFCSDQDKIWSFWTGKESLFSEVVCKRWSSLKISFPERNRIYTKKLKRYTYQSIRSDDFRDYILSVASSHSNIHFEETAVLDFREQNDHVIIDTLSGSYTGRYLFQSIQSYPADVKNSEDVISLKQHFLGWEVETDKPVFDTKTVSLMEFSEPLENGICFYYLLPFSSTCALIEYTVFSPALLQQDIYEEHLNDYISHQLNLKASQFRIVRKEFGVLPMENIRYKNHIGNRIINLGTISGLTKPSTGYAFLRIQNQTEGLVTALQTNNLNTFLDREPSAYIFKVFDTLLLHILQESTQDSMRVFQKLFKNNSFDLVLKFLGEETSAIQNLKIMLSVPSIPFIKAILKTRRFLFHSY